MSALWLLVNCTAFIRLSHTHHHFITNTDNDAGHTSPQDSLPPDPRSHSGLCPGSLSEVRRLKGSFTIWTVLIRFSLCSKSRLQSRSDHRGYNQGDLGSMSPAQLHDLMGKGGSASPTCLLPAETDQCCAENLEDEVSDTPARLGRPQPRSRAIPCLPPPAYPHAHLPTRPPAHPAHRPWLWPHAQSEQGGQE